MFSRALQYIASGVGGAIAGRIIAPEITKQIIEHTSNPEKLSPIYSALQGLANIYVIEASRDIGVLLGASLGLATCFALRAHNHYRQKTQNLEQQAATAEEAYISPLTSIIRRNHPQPPTP